MTNDQPPATNDHQRPTTNDQRPTTNDGSSLPELYLYPALDAANHAGDAGAVGGELARKVPRLSIGELPVDPAVLHREALERPVDLLFLRKSRADEFPHDGAICVPRELQLDVVIDRGDAGPPDPRPGESVRHLRLHLNRRSRFRLRIRTLEA